MVGKFKLWVNLAIIITDKLTLEKVFKKHCIFYKTEVSRLGCVFQWDQKLCMADKQRAWQTQYFYIYPIWIGIFCSKYCILASKDSSSSFVPNLGYSEKNPVGI